MIRIEIQRLDKRDSYRAIVAGEVIVAASRQPELDAARVLVTRGITGRAETWRPGSTAPALRLYLERAAGFTVEESETRGPRFKRWRPHPRAVAPMPVSGAAPEAQAASWMPAAPP